MLIERMRKRLAAESKFIEPCLPFPAEKPLSGSIWIHEIKHDGQGLHHTRTMTRLEQRGAVAFAPALAVAS
jgi:hypothetical protein